MASVDLPARVIKELILSYLRYKRQIFYIASEFEFKDIYFINKKNEDTEIEVKISRSDLKADLKKSKHTKKNKMSTDFFYYAVPKSMVEYTIDFIEQNNLNDYGVIGVEIFGGIDPRVYIYKSAIKSRQIGDINFKKTELIKRMASEICGLHRRLNEQIDGKREEKRNDYGFTESQMNRYKNIELILNDEKGEENDEN